MNVTPVSSWSLINTTIPRHKHLIQYPNCNSDYYLRPHYNATPINQEFLPRPQIIANQSQIGHQVAIASRKFGQD